MKRPPKQDSMSPKADSANTRSGGVQNSARTRAGLMPATVILITALCAFLPWLLSGKVLAPLDIVEDMYLPWRSQQLPNVHNHFVSDAVTQYLPYRMVAAESIGKDGYIGWNPLVFGGTAQSSNTMALSYDWATQLHHVFDFWTAWHIGLIGRFFVAGLGMMVFLLSRGCGTWLATGLGIAYMLNTEFVTWIYHQWALASFCWMPWLLWAAHAAREKSHCYLAAAAFFLALSLLGATLQHAAFILIALGCMWLGWIAEGRFGSTKAFSAVRSAPCGKRVLPDTVLLFITGLLGTGLVAFMLEPTIAGYLENLRAGHIREGVGYTFGLSQPLRMALALPLTLYPFVLGSVQTLDLTKAFVPSGITYAFFGTVPMLLAIVGLFSRRVPPAAKLLIAAGLILPLTPLVGLLYQRVSLLWILGGCWAAGVWASSATEIELKKLHRWGLSIVAAIIATWICASIVLVVFHAQLEEFLMSRVSASAASSQFGIFTAWLQRRASGLIGYLAIWNFWQLLGLAGLTISLWGISNSRLGETLRGLFLTIGLLLQLSVFWWQWTTWVEPSDVYAQSVPARAVVNEVGNAGRLAQGSGTSAELPFPPNTLIPLGIAITGGYDSIHPHGMRSPTAKSWDFPGTTHFFGSLQDEQPPGWQKVWSDGLWVLLCNPEPVVGLITTESGIPAPLRPRALSRSSMNRMEVAVPAGALKFEIFSNWHRGWKWRRGEESEWYNTAPGPANGIEIVLSQPPRDSTTIYLQFNPTPPAWALVLTCLSGATLIFWVFATARRRKTNSF